MEFDRRKMSFEEADRAFEDLSAKRDAGTISSEEFDAERERLMVLDDQGRWWAKSGETGAWNYHDGSGWVPATPPGYEPPPEKREEAKAVAASTPAASTPREEESGRSSSRWPLAVFGLLVILLAAGAFFFLTRGSGGDDVAPRSSDPEVPNLVGATSIEVARQRAGDEFEVVEGNSEESKQPIGSVVGQDRGAGETLAAGSVITVSVSRGVEVLDVVGNERDYAVGLLEDRLFDVKTETRESPEYREGKVVSQEPGGGEFVESEATITLVIGSGTDETAEVEEKEVPDVAGETVERAQEMLEEAGFGYAVEDIESDQAAGTVVSTEPASGAKAEPGTTITILRSSGPPPGETYGGDGGSNGGAAGGQYVPPDPYDNSWSGG